jgi:CheY-like chemotaxis protein
MSSDSTRKEHILLVDDEKHLLISLRDYLTFEHFTVTTARSGEEALEQLERITPDLIVLDISMPGIGGLGFLKRISSPGGKPRYPVLVLTARSMMADFFQDLAIDGFVAKPCDEAELTAMIRSILAKRQNETEQMQRVRRSILLAENEETIAGPLIAALKNAGYDVETVGTGPELLEKATASKPDIILTKEILPEMNGDSVATLLEVMPSTKGIPIVIYDDTRTGPDASERIKRIRNVRKFLRTSNPASILEAIKAIIALD